MEASILKKNGEMRSGKWYTSMRADADIEVNRILQDYINSFEDNETSDDW